MYLLKSSTLQAIRSILYIYIRTSVSVFYEIDPFIQWLCEPSDACNPTISLITCMQIYTYLCICVHMHTHTNILLNCCVLALYMSNQLYIKSFITTHWDAFYNIKTGPIYSFQSVMMLKQCKEAHFTVTSIKIVHRWSQVLELWLT